MNESILENVGIFRDLSDDTLKNVFRKSDNNEVIEMTLVQNKPTADVFCVPSHHFCSLGCRMCHLTNERVEKRMVPIEYDAFFEALSKTVYKNNLFPTEYKRDSHKRRTTKQDCLISFMGVGEPLLNIELIRNIFLHEQEMQVAFGYKHIGYALSTIFPHKNVKELYNLVDLGMPLKVHFSLHSPISDERKALLPSTSVSVEEALFILSDYRRYFQEHPVVVKRFAELHRVMDPVEIHYTLIEGVNDSDTHLLKLISLLKTYPIQLKFILFNPIGDMRRSPNLDVWVKQIVQSVPDINVVAYEPPGREIGSSCGEFTKHYYHYNIESKSEYAEFLQWEKKHIIYEE